MKKNRKIIILGVILLILVSIILLLFNSIKMKNKFVQPQFEKNVSLQIPENINYNESIIEVMEGYHLYIDAVPKIEDNRIIVNFISLDTNNIWIKIRILSSDDEVVAESGLVKPGEYLESIKLNKSVNSDDNIIYEIIGYEIDSYLSAGTIKLNTKVGA